MRSDFPIVVALALALGLGGRRRSQAFVESWFGKLKERCVWRAKALLFWGTP